MSKWKGGWTGSGRKYGGLDMEWKPLRWGWYIDNGVLEGAVSKSGRGGRPFYWEVWISEARIGKGHVGTLEEAKGKVEGYFELVDE